MISFTSKKLGDIAFITKLAGFEHTKYIQGKCSHTKLDDSYIPLFIGKTIHEGKIDDNFDWYISKSISDQLPRSKLNKKCLIVPYVGSLGDIAIFPATYEAHLGSNVGKIELNPDSGYSETFLYYYLKSPIGQQYLLKEEQGGVQKNITMEAIRNVLLPDLDLSTQKKIADVLSCIDDKIALNNKTNTELENMAKTVYDYWFTQFDFTDKNGHPYKTSGGQMVYNETLKRDIPAGWEVGKLSDIAYFSTETTGSENLQNYITTDNILPNKQGVTKAEFIPTYGNVLKYEEYDILIANIRPYFKKIWLSNTTGMCSNDVLCIKAKKSIYNFFLYRFLWRDDFFDYVMKGAKGSKMPRGDKKHIMSMPIPIPNNNTLLESFNAFYGPLQNQIWENQKENDELTNIRNYLLPLLMNGQIEVK